MSLRCYDKRCQRKHKQSSRVAVVKTQRACLKTSHLQVSSHHQQTMSSTAATYDASEAPEIETKTEENQAPTSQSDNTTSRDKHATNATDKTYKEDAVLYTPLRRPSLLLTPDSKYQPRQPSSAKKMPFRCDQYNCKYWVTKGWCRNRLTTCKWRHDEERRNIWPWIGDQDEVFPDLVGQYSE